MRAFLDLSCVYAFPGRPRLPETPRQESPGRPPRFFPGKIFPGKSIRWIIPAIRSSAQSPGATLTMGNQIVFVQTATINGTLRLPNSVSEQTVMNVTFSGITY